MNVVSPAGGSRISALMGLTQALRECRTPYDALLKYAGFLGEAYPDRAQLIVSTRDLAEGQFRVWRLRTDDGVEHVPLCDPWTDFTSPLHSGGVIARITANPTPQVLHDIDWGDDSSVERALSPYRSLIAVPLFNERLPLNWSVMLVRDPTFFTTANLEDSVNRATLIGSLLDSLYVGKQLAEANAHIDRELQRMARIQRALLPQPIPDIPGVRLAASYETFIQVGGDLYDLIPLGIEPQRWCLFIGDASGHGPSAAVSAAMVQATLHACAAGADGPAALLGAVNRHLCNKPVEGSFVTAFLAFYEPATRRLTYSSAGHPPPLLASRDGAAATFLEDAASLPLGIDAEEAFTEVSIELLPGQLLLLYTDGITESRAPDGSMFGAEGLQQSLQTVTGTADTAIAHLRASLNTHQRGRPPTDDQTMVLIEVSR